MQTQFLVNSREQERKATKDRLISRGVIFSLVLFSCLFFISFSSATNYSNCAIYGNCLKSGSSITNINNTNTTQAIWGNITGTITNQVDLINYLSSNYYPNSNPSGFVTSGYVSSNYYGLANSFGYYNSTTIPNFITWATASNGTLAFNSSFSNYFTSSQILGFNYYNSTNLQNLSQLSNNNLFCYGNGTNCNATYLILNSTGLIKDWNSTGYIANWNATGYIKNWGNSTALNTSEFQYGTNVWNLNLTWLINYVTSSITSFVKWDSMNTNHSYFQWGNGSSNATQTYNYSTNQINVTTTYLRNVTTCTGGGGGGTILPEFSSGLVAYYPTNETSGSTLYDASGNGLNLSGSGSYTLGQTVGSQTGVDFSGGNFQSNSFPSQGNNPWSVSFWYQTNSPSGVFTPWWIGNQASCGGYVRDVWIYGTHYIDRCASYITTTNGIDTSLHNEIITYTGSTMTVYIDGINSGSMGTSLSITNGHFQIGSDPSGAFNGLIANVGYWSNVLNSTQISDLQSLNSLLGGGGGQTCTSNLTTINDNVFATDGNGTLALGGGNITSYSLPSLNTSGILCYNATINKIYIGIGAC